MLHLLKVFLLQQKGDYLQTVKCLEHLTSLEGNSDDLLKLLLVESYLGIPNINSLASLQASYEARTSGADGRYRALIEQAKSFLDLKSDSDVRVRVSELAAEFKESPRHVCAELILMQEVCL